MPFIAASLPPAVSHILSVLQLALGFGFVIFFHELGHFIAAKWVGIKVEQFAVGFGQALFSWRKGIGVRLGNTQKEYRARLEDYFAKTEPVTEGTKLDSASAEDVIRAEKELGLGETEYRLNWIPLGGYVKMLGQDDLRPNSQAEDPRSYNRKSIRARMLVVSAGVTMNIILAGIGFMTLFLIGFHVPPAWVGSITSGSPAQMAMKQVDGKLVHAPLEPGVQILEYQGKPQEDFTKIGLNTALSAGGQPETMKVRHANGAVDSILITPQPDDANGGFLSIGVRAPQELRGLDPKDVDESELKKAVTLEPDDALSVRPGETITRINGQTVKPDEYWKLNEAIQNPNGAPASLTVRNDKDGTERQTMVRPHFSQPFGNEPLSFAGMVPRPAISMVLPNSPAVGKVRPGDVVTAISMGKDTQKHPTPDEFRSRLKDAGDSDKPVSLVLLREGQHVTLNDLPASAKIENGKGQKSRGLGVGLAYDEMNAVVAGTVKGSTADLAGVPSGAVITAIGDNKVKSWFDVQRYLGAAAPGVPVAIHFSKDAIPDEKRELTLSDEQIFQIKGLQRSHDLSLHDLQITRKALTASGHLDPLKAAYWGVTETRDFILQFYVTLHRMIGGSVSPNQLMGPVGIFVGGAKFAFKGTDWLLWFLAMISANLAVVNFLPIPIVDGGLFTFLILEKIQGRPLSPKAQAIAQYVGLAFLAGVFLFVTYHDIVRYVPWG